MVNAEMKLLNLVLVAITTCAIFSKAGLCETRPESIPIVENPISFNWGKPLDWESGTGGYVPIYAKFWFQELPSFQRTIALNLSFQAKKDFKQSIVIGMFGRAESFDVIPTETIWQGPIQKGDIYETSVNLLCREIGRYFLKAVLAYEGKHLFDFGVQWFLDSNDNVYHLSSRPMLVVDEESNRLPLNYLKDELVMKYRYHLQGDPKEREGFHSMISIKPIPSLNDTVDVIYSVEATNNFPNGVQMKLIATSNLAVVEMPKNWTGNVKKNDVYEGVIKVIFKTPGESYLKIKADGYSVNPSDGDTDHHTKWAEIYFQIGEDGKLLYAGRKDKHDRPGKASALVAEQIGDKHDMPFSVSYYFEPRIKPGIEQGSKK